MPLFAVQIPDGAAGGLIAVIMTCGPGAVWLLNYLAKRRERIRAEKVADDLIEANAKKDEATAQTQARKDTIAEQQEMLAAKDRQIERQQAQIEEMQRVINRLREMYDESRQDSGDLWSMLVLLHGVAKQLEAIGKRAGVDMDGLQIPMLPERQRRGRESEADYLQRTTQHNTDSGKVIVAQKTSSNP